jgi:Family of unknown function (DUF6356)
MFHRLFLDHPHAMGETYFEHQRVALSFAVRLLAASLACAVHALVPGLCVSTGSRAVADLNDRLVTNRRRQPAFEDRVWPA